MSGNQWDWGKTKTYSDPKISLIKNGYVAIWHQMKHLQENKLQKFEGEKIALKNLISRNQL